MPKCPFCDNTVDIYLVKTLSVPEIQAMLDSVDTSRLEGDADKFYNDIKVRMAKWGEKTKLTVPQREWLKKLSRLYPAISPELRAEKPDEEF